MGLSEGKKVRLQVFLSHSGVCSRRRALDLVKEGHVTVNQKKIVEPSTPVSPGSDRICVDGREVKTKKYDYIVLNKPAGYITTKADRFAEKTVLDLLPKKLQHLIPVGRLDKNTKGLLILTNDGELTYHLTHPKFNVPKVYQVRITGELGKERKSKLEQGVVVEGKKTAPAKIEKVRKVDKQTEFYMTIHEGRKRQIRLMVAKVGQKVVSLTRIAQGPLRLGSLQTGRWRFLNEGEIKRLKNNIR